MTRPLITDRLSSSRALPSQRMTWICAALCCLVWLQGGARLAIGEGPKATEPTRLLASVGDVLITQADVDLSLGRTASGQSELPPIPEPVLMSSVDLIARQRQALESLKRSKKRVSDTAIDKWLLENSPPELKLTADQALGARAEAAKVSKENYREFLAFRLSWQAYLQNMLSDTNLEKHFANQKPRFDGTRFQVEHVWIAAPPGKSSTRQSAHQRLSQLREQVANGKLSMAEVGKEVASEAGEKAAASLWMTGSGPLMPTVIDHVLKTPAGKVTEPFDSAQAVHMVRVIAIEPGQQTLADAKENVRKHMLLYLLDFLASQSAKEMPLVWQGS